MGAVAQLASVNEALDCLRSRLRANEEAMKRSKISRGWEVTNILTTYSSWQSDEYAQVVLECGNRTARSKTSDDHSVNIPKDDAAQWAGSKCICQVSSVLWT